MSLQFEPIKLMLSSFSTVSCQTTLSVPPDKDLLSELQGNYFLLCLNFFSGAIALAKVMITIILKNGIYRALSHRILSSENFTRHSGLKDKVRM